jgi:hypothetical protein
MSPTVWDVLDLVLAVLFAAGFFYFYAFGIHFQDRALSRASGFAFLVCAGVAAWMIVRILR